MNGTTHKIKKANNYKNLKLVQGAYQDQKSGILL